jgi:hypothetical protein
MWDCVFCVRQCGILFPVVALKYQWFGREKWESDETPSSSNKIIWMMPFYTPTDPWGSVLYTFFLFWFIVCYLDCSFLLFCLHIHSVFICHLHSDSNSMCFLLCSLLDPNTHANISPWPSEAKLLSDLKKNQKWKITANFPIGQFQLSRL